MSNRQVRMAKLEVRNTYKLNAVPSAETIVTELERIYDKTGELQPERVVDAARPKRAPLHSAFEWDDSVAAEKHRLEQARCLIRCVHVVSDDDVNHVPAFINVEQGSYAPLTVTVKSQDALKAYFDQLFDRVNAAQDALTQLSRFVEREERGLNLCPILHKTSEQLSDIQRSLGEARP